MLPPFSRFLPTFLSLSLADCITLCRRQAVWPVHSSVASSVLSLSVSPSLSTLSLSLSLSILIPFLAVHSSLAHLHCRCRYPRTRFVPAPSACAIPALRACAIRSSASTVSFASQSFKTGTVPIENINTTANTPFCRLIAFPSTSGTGRILGTIKPSNSSG